MSFEKCIQHISESVRLNEDSGFKDKLTKIKKDPILIKKATLERIYSTNKLKLNLGDALPDPTPYNWAWPIVGDVKGGYNKVGLDTSNGAIYIENTDMTPEMEDNTITIEG